MDKQDIPQYVIDKAKEWLKPPYDAATQKIVQNLLDEKGKELIDAFGSDLSFGTGGLRSLMGVGTAKLNLYTIACATQGLANYLIRHKGSLGSLSIVVGFDSRHFSKEFAIKTAEVLAANSIKVFLFQEIRPTPFISFACRHLKASGAVMITASHNPKEYNGYKVYGSDGAQVVFPHDEGIIQEVKNIKTYTQVKLNPSAFSLITAIGNELDSAYLEAIKPLQLTPHVNQQEGKTLKIAYTSLHGTGITIVPQALNSWGFSDIELEKNQTIADGAFPTVDFPNPEIKETLELGKDLLLKTNADILIATDPDADRLGVVINVKGEAHYLNGNEMAALCLEYLLQSKKAANTLSNKDFVVSTIVTTRLLKKQCSAYNVSYFDVLTGFKYIAEKIYHFEKIKNGGKFLFGAEESYGYLYGTQARDKDAIIMSCLIAEMTLQAKTEGKTLKDKLFGLYEKYGIFLEGQKTHSFPAGVSSMQDMQVCMNNLRRSPLKQLKGLKVVAFKDYLLKQEESSISSSSFEFLPSSDVLEYHFEDNSVIIIRPSGTEPKIKIYAGVVEQNFQVLQQGRQTATYRLENLLKNTQEHLIACLIN